MLTACLALLTLMPQTDAAKFLDVALAPYQKGPFKIAFTPGGGYFCEFSKGKSGQLLSIKGGGEILEFRSDATQLVELDLVRKQYYATEVAQPFEAPLGEVAEELSQLYPGILQLSWSKQLFSNPGTKIVEDKTGTTLSVALQTPEGNVKVSFQFDPSRKPLHYKLINENRKAPLEFHFGKVVWEVNEATLVPTIPAGYDPIYLPDAPYGIDTESPWPEMKLTSATTSTPVNVTSQLKPGKPSLLMFGRYDEVISAQTEVESLFKSLSAKFASKANFTHISLTAKPGSANLVATAAERRKMAAYATPMLVLLGPNREVLQMWQGNVDGLAKLVSDELAEATSP